MDNSQSSRREQRRASVTVRDSDFEPATIKFIHRDGYGFVSRENGKPDAYFHLDRVDDSVRDQLAKGMSVTVAVGSGSRGPVVLVLRA